MTEERIVQVAWDNPVTFRMTHNQHKHAASLITANNDNKYMYVYVQM
jgi:hypothetical protein